VPGVTPNFSAVGVYTWTIAKATTPIIGFSQTEINLDIDTEGFFGADELLFDLAVSADGLELQVLYNRTGPLPGDTNGDCFVNVLDMIAIRNHLGDPAASWQAFDVNNDGFINVIDMIFVRNNLNETC